MFSLVADLIHTPNSKQSLLAKSFNLIMIAREWCPLPINKDVSKMYVLSLQITALLFMHLYLLPIYCRIDKLICKTGFL